MRFALFRVKPHPRVVEWTKTWMTPEELQQTYELDSVEEEAMYVDVVDLTADLGSGDAELDDSIIDLTEDDDI